MIISEFHMLPIKNNIKYMKKLLFLLAFLTFSLSWGQQDIYSNNNTANWSDDTNKPWYYSSWLDQNRPDNDGRGNVNIGHSGYTTMNVNTAFFQLRLLSIAASSNNSRIFNASDGGGISLSNGIYNNSFHTLTFNVPIGVDDTTVHFSAINGNMEFTTNFYLNPNTANFSGSNNVLVSGVISGSGNINKSDSGALTLSGTNTYTGNTIVYAGTLEVTGIITSTTGVITVKTGATLIVNGIVKAKDLVVEGAGNVLVKAGKTLEIIDAITNAGVIEIEHEGSLVQVNETDGNSGAGLFQIHKTTPEYADYDYTYWSSPVDAETIGNVLSGSIANYIFSLNTANFEDRMHGYGFPQGTLGSDSFDDTGDDWVHANAGTTLVAGKGYIAMGEGSDFPLDFINIEIDNTQSVVFDGGKVNNGVITVPVTKDKYNEEGTYNDANSAHTNANLVGNPYPSAIDVVALRTDSDNLTLLEGTFYVWTHDTQITSGGGPWAYNFTNDDYATLTVDTSGNFSETAAGNGGGTHASRYIASGQGFLANVISAGNVTFNNAMRVTGNNDQFRNPEINIDRVWLNLTHDVSPLFRQILVGFYEGATDTYQNGQDGQRMENGDNTDFYSIISNDTRHLAIQNLATFNETKTVALGLEIIAAGAYTITIDHVEGIFDTQQDIYLKDYKTNSLHNLSQDRYVFNVTDTELGEINDRFELRFIDEAAGIDEAVINSVAIFPNPSEQIFNISWNGQAKASIIVYDLAGKLIKTESIQQNSNSYQLDLSGYASGFYYVKIQLEGQQIVKKLVLK